MEDIVPVVREIAKRERFDIVLNLDHGLTINAIERALANGFTSIMFDGSNLEFEEKYPANLRSSADVPCLEYFHRGGIGSGRWGRRGSLLGAADPAKYTDIEQARIFVQRTGVDALAVAIGNSHGRYKGPPMLDF